jgi:NADPH:quinone reductase
MKALVFEKFGGPEVLFLAQVPDPLAQVGQVIVKTEAVGLNFADIYRRRGNYHLQGQPPYILGYEGAGVVESVGAEVSHLKPGMRVAFADCPFANAEKIALPQEKAILLPDDVSATDAAALLLQGLTAHFLCHDSRRVAKGEAVLVHAAAGGVGLLLTQLCTAKGARVLAVVSSADKALAAREAGAEDTCLSSEDWVARAKAFRVGGVDVVYDSVGSTLPQSFEATRIGGQVIFYGMSGGDPAAVDPRMLMDTSKTLTGGDLWNVLTSVSERQSRADALFALKRSGVLRLQPPTLFPLARGAEAHALLESRKTIGKIVLVP